MPNPFAFLAYIVVTAYTPGPNNIMSLSNASIYGFKKSFPFNLGILCGTLAVLTLCTIFSAALLSLIPKIKLALIILGAAYMLFLAYKTLKSSPSAAHGPVKNRSTLISGVALQFMNPKIIIYAITSMSSFVLPYYQSPLSITLFILLLAFTGFSATVCWSLFGAVFNKFLQSHARVINPIMAALLVYCAVSLFL